MINIAELLKDCPKGTKLYSPLFGEVEFSYIGGVKIRRIWVCTTSSMRMFSNEGKYCFTHDGETVESQECLLFPSKEVRTWEGWKAPKPHYDIANFQPFDKVLVRDSNGLKWTADLFSYIDDGFVCTGGIPCRQCIPYNDDTLHLLGTTDMPSEEYINW